MVRVRAPLQAGRVWVAQTTAVGTVFLLKRLSTPTRWLVPPQKLAQEKQTRAPTDAKSAQRRPLPAQTGTSGLPRASAQPSRPAQSPSPSGRRRARHRRATRFHLQGSSHGAPAHRGFRRDRGGHVFLVQATIVADAPVSTKTYIRRRFTGCKLLAIKLI